MLASSQHRQAAPTGELVQRRLHDRPDVGVDDREIRILAEASDDVDRRQHLRDYLGRQRDVNRYDGTESEREAYGDRQNIGPKPVEPEPLCQPRAACEEQLTLLTTD